ncbi:15726_t:CDS:2, partial [Entrophospora sp. SA101]
ESDKQMLILQCDITTVNVGCIKLAKFVIEQLRGEFLIKRRNSNKKIPMKHACIILHIHREQETPFVSFNFMCGWEQITIETLQVQDKPLSSLLEKSMADIINTTYPFEDILKQELLWCLSCMKYPHSQKSLDHIRVLITQIPNNKNLITCLKDRTQEWLETSSEPNWQNKVASDKKLLYPYSSFSGALQAYLRIFIRKPIAKLLCAIERLSATRTLLLIDRPRKIEEVEQSHKLLEFWIECFMDPKIVNTEDIPDPKPDVYTMPANNYDLEFPFSLYFMKRIDSFKRLFEDEINQHKENEGNIDEQTGELYQHFFNDYTKGFSTTVINSIPSFKKPSLNLFADLYFNDFVAVVSSNDSAGNRNPKVLSFLLQRLMGEEKFLDPVFLHAYWWRNSNTVLAEFQLTQICPMVISKITACNNSESFEHSLVREIAGIMLQNISESRNLTYNSYMFEQWQRDVTKILSFGAKVLKGQPLPSLQILRICNDFISTKAIPLANVKEIITIGKNSSQKEMLSAEFINKVFDILYKMEPNEKNLISRRSFILRCLDIVDLESKLRLQLYGKIFSQRPFPLMSAIIQRIFLQEDEDEDESIFLTILENPGLAIRDSARLNVINTCLKNQGLDSMMSTLCCDVIQTLFETFELSDLANYFGFAAKAITNLGTEALQKITAIAFLKVFVEGFWNECIQRHNYQQPIVFDLMETDGAVLIKEINDFMSIPNPLIHSLKIYFLRILRNRHNLPLNDVKQFCNRQNRTLPWLASIAWEDNSQNRLSFNPYWALDMYAEADKGFSSLYSLKNKAPIKIFLQSVQKNESMGHRIAFGGVVVQRIHLVHASNEWSLDYDNASKDLRTEINGMKTLTPLYRQIIDNIIQNKQPLLQLNIRTTNETLLIKSVIGHIVILHSSIPADSSPLTIYLNNLQNCHTHYILTAQADNESVIMNALTSTTGEQLTRYSCQCGYKYVIANCGQAMEARKCPQCSNTIGGGSHKSAAGNQKLDHAPQRNMTVVNQPGYVEDLVEPGIGHTVRAMPPNAYRILHLIVHALIGSSNHAKNFLKINGNAEEYCLKHIQNDWNALKRIFNCNDENLALLLHSILTEMSKKLFTGSPSIITDPAQRDAWELRFVNEYVEPQTKSFNESITNFRRKLDAELKKANGNTNIIESEINQTIDMDDNYKVEYLPNLWRTIGAISFESFRAYYIADQTNNNKTYPFLSIFFKHSEKLTQIKHLFPIIKFAEILASRLEYRINRKDAHNKSFQEFINDESNGGIVKETHETLAKAFGEFSEAWNAVHDQVKRYQCSEFKSVIPKVTLDSPIAFGLVEEKDTGIFICAIINYLVGLQNNFLLEITTIPNGSCKSLKFLEEPSQVDAESTSGNGGSSSSSTQANNSKISNQYYLRLSRANQLIKSNVIDYEWDEDILQYSQRILAIGRGDDVIYDLQKIELELARWLVFDKAYIETVQDLPLYLEPFSYHMELFQGYLRILSDIKNIIPQEPIPTEKILLIRGEAGNINNNIFVSSTQYTNNYVLDDASDILSSLEVLLCFVKRNAVGQEDTLIQDYVAQWMKLSSLTTKPTFANLLNAGLTLKHVVALYEFVEEQVANRVIEYINDVYKERLTSEQENEITDVVDFTNNQQQPTLTAKKTPKKIPADALIVALKRFMLRFLSVESKDYSKHPLSVYLTDIDLNFWSSEIDEAVIDLFPETLLASHTFEIYRFCVSQIEDAIRKQIHESKIKPTGQSSNTTGQSSNTTRSKKGKKPGKTGHRFDIT